MTKNKEEKKKSVPCEVCKDWKDEYCWDCQDKLKRATNAFIWDY